MLPPELLQHIYTYCDIDTRQTLHKVFGHKLFSPIFKQNKEKLHRDSNSHILSNFVQRRIQFNYVLHELLLESTLRT